MKKSKSDKRKPVADVVHTIMDQVRIARADGPSSGLYGRDAQLSASLTRAGTLLAKMDHAESPKRSALQSLLGSLTTAHARPRRRSWFFAAGSSAMPDAKRIEQMLQAATKDGRRLVLDQDMPDNPSDANNDINCVLPAGAVDPVCEPR